MTEKELNLIEILANVWNEYLQLPEQHCNDRQEFCEAIHRLQHLLMIRDARRNHPDVWQQVREAASRRYMTDALPHLLMYLAGIHAPYYRPDLNILSPEYNEQRPRILKNQTDYDVLMAE